MPLFFLLLLFVSLLGPVNAAVARVKGDKSWRNVSCNVSSDQNPGNMTQSYVDARVPEAWKEVMDGWNAYMKQKIHPDDTAVDSFEMYMYDETFKEYGIAYRKCTFESDNCNSVDCIEGYPAAVVKITRSIFYLWTFLRDIISCFELAKNLMLADLESFAQTFAQIPADNNEMTKSLLDLLMVVGLFIVPVSIMPMIQIGRISVESANIIQNALVGAVIALHNMEENFMKESTTYQDEAQAMDKLLRTFVGDIYASMQAWLNQLVAAKDAERQQQLTDFVQYGGINSLYLNLDLSNPGFGQQVTTYAMKALWAMLLTPTWRASKSVQKPFVLRVDKNDYPCGDVLSKARIDLKKWMHPAVAKEVYCDGQGNSFFLVNANDQKKSCGGGLGIQSCNERETRPFQLLDGGTKETLGKYNITIENIMLATYGAYLLNGNKNGYVPSYDSQKMVNKDWTIEDTPYNLPMFAGIASPGFYNLSVCLDAKKAAENIQNSKFYNNAPCEDSDNDVAFSVPMNTKYSYNPGKCTAHVTWWRTLYVSATRDYTSSNPLNNTQVSVAIEDAGGHLIAWMPKQPIQGALRWKPTLPGTDHRLPYDFTISTTTGSNADDGHLSFWYSDQYWLSNDDDHECQFPYWSRDDSNSVGSCTFQCPNPTDPAPTPASDSQAIPEPIEDAYTGNGHNGNEGTKPKAKYWKSGWCGLHIRQFQRNENGDGYKNPFNDYTLEIAVKDFYGVVVGYQSQTISKQNSHVAVKSLLPWEVLAYTGDSDDDPIKFRYGGTHWDTNGDWCSVDYSQNGYENGKRDIDCGFPC